MQRACRGLVRVQMVREETRCSLVIRVTVSIRCDNPTKGVQMSADDLTLVLESPTVDGAGVQYRVVHCQQPLLDALSGHFRDAHYALARMASAVQCDTEEAALAEAKRQEQAGMPDTDVGYDIDPDDLGTEYGVMRWKLHHPLKQFAEETIGVAEVKPGRRVVSSTAVYEHDSQCCSYLGSWWDADNERTVDLYACAGRYPTVLARYSDYVPDFDCGLAFVDENPALAEALRRGLEKGVLVQK